VNAGTPPTSPPKVCVLVPSYNNAGTIASVVERSVALGLPVLVLDDGSTDATPQLAREAGAEVVSHDINRGKGRALRTGWQAAADRGFTHAVTLDGDGQHMPEDVPVFLEAIEAAPDALFVGDRPMTGEHVPRSSRIGRAISDFMLVAAAALELKGERPDTQCGFRAYPLRHALALPLKTDRFQMEMEVLVQAAWHRVPVRGVSIRVHYPDKDERVTHFHKWQDNVRIVSVYTRLMLIRLFWPILRPRKKLLPPPKR
jgi:glycosyltransferase involved in cell wall biosynthesis